jgi:hypothetical protein
MRTYVRDCSSGWRRHSNSRCSWSRMSQRSTSARRLAARSLHGGDTTRRTSREPCGDRPPRGDSGEPPCRCRPRISRRRSCERIAEALVRWSQVPKDSGLPRRAPTGVGARPRRVRSARANADRGTTARVYAFEREIARYSLVGGDVRPKGHDHLPALRAPSVRDHAERRVPVLLRLSGLRRDASPARGRLLCLLLLCRQALPSATRAG